MFSNSDLQLNQSRYPQEAERTKMKVNWFLNKDEESGDVHIFVSGDRARCMKTKEILDAVQHIDYGSNANEIKVIIY